MTRGTEHAPVIARLRGELGALRAHGEISEQFANWHRRLTERRRSRKAVETDQGTLDVHAFPATLARRGCASVQPKTAEPIF
jgi:hypothetical protein